MIINYQRYNKHITIIEIYWLFLVIEFIELLKLLNLYDGYENKVKKRQFFWIFISFMVISGFLFLFGLAALLSIIKFFS